MQGGLGGCPNALYCVPVQEAGRLLRQRELGFDAGLLGAVAVKRRQLGNRTIWVLAASLGHDKARCSDKGAKEAGCVRLLNKGAKEAGCVRLLTSVGVTAMGSR